MDKKVITLPIFCFLLFGIFFENSISQERSYVKNPLKLTEYVTDETSTLKPEELSILRTRLKNFYDSTSTQIVVLILKSLNGETIEEVANSVFRYNKIGTKGKDNGILLLISKGDRKIRIEVGYGLEGVLPDVLAKKIIQTEISPSLKNDRYYEGITRGVETLISVTKGEYKVSSTEKETKSSNKNTLSTIIVITIVVIFVLIFIFSFIRSIIGMGKRRKGEAGSYFSSYDSNSSYSSDSYSSSSSSDSGFSGGGGDSGGGGASDDF